MLAGWIVAHLVYFVFITRTTKELGSLLFFTALPALIAYVLIVLPLLALSPRTWLYHPRLAPMAWVLLGVVSFTVLVLIPDGAGFRDALFLYPFPTVMGLVAGLLFPRLNRKYRAKYRGA
jgi:hypothetical protein